MNPGLDYSAVVVRMLSNSIQQIHRLFVMFNEEAKGANTELVDELLKTIENFKLKHKIEVTPDIDRVISTEDEQVKNTINEELEKKIDRVR
jgi:predicted lipase